MTSHITTQQNEFDVLPAIIVSDIEHHRLMGLASAAEDRAPEVASVLQSEMERAHVVRESELPTNVVRMGSTVEFVTDTGQRRRVTLVFPKDADIAIGRVSILTPVGAALIGLSPGQSIAWTARDGQRHRLAVLNVEAPAAEEGGISVSDSSVVVLQTRRGGRAAGPDRDPNGDDPGPQAA